jgi:predicted transcriptional regulator
VRERGLVSRREVLARFPNDEEAQLRSVLRDLCESQLVFSSGSAGSRSYRAASAEDLATLQQDQGQDGADELLIALIYREEPLTLREIAAKAQREPSEIEPIVARLLANGRIDQVEGEPEPRYRVGGLVIPFGASSGWEAAVFDHFKAVVMTVLCKLRDHRSADFNDVVGGSTYTIDVWDGHPLTEEVYGTLARVRGLLGDLRRRAEELRPSSETPARHTRVVIYAGQCLIHEDDGRAD